MVKWDNIEQEAKELIAEIAEGTPDAKVLIAAVKPSSGAVPGAEDWVIAQTGLTPPQIASMTVYMLADYFLKRNASEDEILKWFAGMAADQIGVMRRLRKRLEQDRERPQLRLIPGGLGNEQPDDEDEPGE